MKTWEEFKNALNPLEKPIVDKYREILMERLATEDILEIGSGWGIFARSALETLKAARLTTIDKIPVEGRQDFNEATAGFEDRIERIVGESREELPKLRHAGRQFDIVLVDGAHDYNNCLNDLRLGWSMLKKGGLLLMDDLFNRHNWDHQCDPDWEDPRTFDYGVARALWDFSKDALPDGYEMKFYKVGSGGLVAIENL